MDFGQFSAVNAAFTLISCIIVAVLTIATSRRLTRYEFETSRKEWSDVAERRLELNKSLQEQIEGLNTRLLGVTKEMGRLQEENRFLRERNLELQKELDTRHEEIQQLRSDLRRAGITVKGEKREGGGWHS